MASLNGDQRAYIERMTDPIVGSVRKRQTNEPKKPVKNSLQVLLDSLDPTDPDYEEFSKFLKDQIKGGSKHLAEPIY